MNLSLELSKLSNGIDHPYTVYSNFIQDWLSFILRYNSSFLESSMRATASIMGLEEKKFERKKIRNTIRATFDDSIRESLKNEIFVKNLSDFIDSFSKFSKLLGYDEIYKFYENVFSLLDGLLEPVRDNVNRTPSEVIKMKGRFDLHHYRSNEKIKYKTPILVVGSLINRHYILDILPQISIIRGFQKYGFDVYATDWKSPTLKDENMTLETYAHDYLENSVDEVKKITSSENVTIFGYCWGGIFSLMYSSIHPENVKNLILHATPIDFEKVPSVVDTWAKNIEFENLIQTFGNIPASFLNLAFLMRNPLEAFMKYPWYFSEPRSMDDVKQFMAVESWLYDSVPIIGRVYKTIIDDIYKKNLLIKNQMHLGKEKIDLKKITMPFLNIVGSNDDLVPPESSRTITDVIASSDKKLLEFPTGHVGLCISSRAHEKLWPQVYDWVSKRS